MAEIDNITIGESFNFRGGSFIISHTNKTDYFISDDNKCCAGGDPFVAGFFNDEPSCRKWLEDNVGTTYKPHPEV